MVAALLAATELGRAISILSAADAGISAGAGWWSALLAAARAAVPSAAFSAVLDCGDDAGAAQAALRLGIGTIIFTGRADVAERLAGIAAATGGRVLTERPAVDLDLVADFFSDAASLHRRCRIALAPQQI